MLDILRLRSERLPTERFPQQQASNFSQNGVIGNNRIEVADNVTFQERRRSLPLNPLGVTNRFSISASAI